MLIFLIITCLFILFLLVVVFKIKSYLALRFYAKQGLEIHWKYGFSIWYNDNIRELKGPDSLQILKDFGKKTNLKGFATNSGLETHITIMDQDALKDFYTSKYINFEKHFIIVEMFSPLIGRNNLFLSNQKEWRNSRSIISKSFSFNRIKSSLSRVINVSKYNFEREENSDKIETLSFFQNIAGESFMISFLGKELMNTEVNGQSISNELAYLLAQIFISFTNRNKALLALELAFDIDLDFRTSKKILLKRIDNFRNIMKEAIKLKREKFEKEGPDDSLICEMFEGNQFTDDEIVDQTTTLFFAGIDTTGHLLAAIMYVFGNHPEYQKEMFKEIREKIGKTENITNETLKDENLPFVNALIQEALRLYNPTGTGLFHRECIKDTKLGDINVKKGTILFIAQYISGHNPNFFENPDIFDPYRWINNPKQEEILRKNPFAFIPFSAGSRNCIGQHFARLEVKATLAYMALNYDVELKKSKSRWIVRFVYETEDSIYMKIRKWKKE